MGHYGWIPALFFFCFIFFLLKNKKFADKLFAGNILKDYGLIDEEQKGIVNVKHSVLLAERNGKRKIVIKEEIFAGLGWNIRYFEFDMGSAQKLRDALNDALKS